MRRHRVAHQAVSQHLGVEPIHCLGDHRQMTLAILVIAVNRLTPVAARCDVVGGVGEFDAQGAGRGVILRGEVGNWLDLTLAPRMSGSVRGVPSNGHPYRDPWLPTIP